MLFRSIERSFQTLKGALGLRPVRFWLEENVTVHLFICHLAYALMTTFRFQIEKSRGERGFSELGDIIPKEHIRVPFGILSVFVNIFKTILLPFIGE